MVLFPSLSVSMTVPRSVFEIERTPAGDVVVYLPGAPNPWSGTVVFVEQSRVEKLDMSVADAIRSIQALGRGSAGYGG